MTLQLRMIKAPDGATPSQEQFSFGPQGGAIGRGPDNQWVLPDPERILSARHCEFLADAGRFQLIDHSTNGTFINGSSEPLGKGVVTTVNQGDRIEVGDYVFVVDLLNAELTPESSSSRLSPFASEPLPDSDPGSPASDDPFASDPFASALVADSDQVSLDPLKALDGASSTGQENLSPWTEEPLAQESSSFSLNGGDSHWEDPSVESVAWPEARSDALIPDDWLDDPGLSSASHSPSQPEVAPTPEPAPPPVTPAPERRVPEPVATTRPVPTASAPEHSGSDLLNAMGVDVNRLDASARSELEPLVGTMMREVVEGLMQVLRSRASIKNEFRMNVTTIQPVENNPLKFSADVDEALDNIFVRRSQAYKEPLQAVREGFQEIAEHQLAMIAGMRSAFEHMLREFDPERLEANFNKQQKPSAISPVRKARYWDNYRAHYKGLSDNLERSFQQIFGDEFVQAYQEQLRRLSALRP